MRSGGSAVQQTLTAEAASVLKHSLSLARRRGHAQVTPLHVAATLLTSTTSLILRRACLKSSSHHHQHPLQCRALELCFNVALNRLPASPAGLPLVIQPCLSNALIAALKRAQAHQRRGSIEQQQQQQPLLSLLKVELEQLVVSILDDPSVSRVMREAGFSSTTIKNNIEDHHHTTSVFHYASGASGGGVFSSPCSPTQTDNNSFPFSLQKISQPEDHIKLIFDALLRKKKTNTVIINDSIYTTENLVSELIQRLETGEVPHELKQTQLIRFQFSPMALRFMKKEDVDTNISELKAKLDRSSGGGTIIYTGDLKWTVEDHKHVVTKLCYSAVDHMVAEIAKLITELTELKVWLVSSASYQTYTRCQMRQPSVQTQWGLHPLSLSSSGSLHASSSLESRMNLSQNLLEVSGKLEQDDKLCLECNSNYEKEAQFFKSAQPNLLPPWLQPHANNSKDDNLVDLRKKWNRLCCILQHQGGRDTQNHYSTTLYNNQYLPGKSYAWWPSPQSRMFPDSSSISFTTDSLLKPSYSSNAYKRQNSCIIEFNLCDIGGNYKKEPSLDSLKNSQGKEVKITLALGTCHSGSSTQTLIERANLSKLLLENVPWQSESIPSIVETMMDAQSRKKDAWLLVEGNDCVGKRRLALAIAESVIGSADLLVHVHMRNRDSAPGILERASSNHEKLVVLVEDVDLLDMKGKFGQSVFILTKSSNSSIEMKNNNNVIQMTLMVNVESTSHSPHKRKAEWELISNESKGRPKLEGDAKDLSRQSSFNSTLDLNMMADEDEDEKQGEFCPITSRDTRKQFVFDTSPARESEMGETLVSKIKGIFQEVFGEENGSKFSVHEKVIEGIIVGTSYFVNSLFERWLKEIFQTSLHKLDVKNELRGNASVKLLLGGGGGIGENVFGVGYMNTCLPNKIQVSFMDYN